jgi:hypothetical protein
MESKFLKTRRSSDRDLFDATVFFSSTSVCMVDIGEFLRVVKVFRARRFRTAFFGDCLQGRSRGIKIRL